MMPKEPEEIFDANNEAAPEAPEIEDVESLKQALAEAERKAAEYLASWQRTQADFINYKRRTEQERQDFSRFASADLILSLLPVLDDMERAIDAIPPEKAGGDWLEGIKLVGRKFQTLLEAQGLAPVKALGEPFDPAFHEAVRQDRGKEGIVIEEFQKGYMMHDKLLRPAKVVVGNGEEGDNKGASPETG
jgi:molecular chaperone GrpE